MTDEIDAEIDEFMRRCILAFVEAHGREPITYEEFLVWIVAQGPDLVLPKGKMS